MKGGKNNTHQSELSEIRNDRWKRGKAKKRIIRGRRGGRRAKNKKTTRRGWPIRLISKNFWNLCRSVKRLVGGRGASENATVYGGTGENWGLVGHGS